jgi:hypothetical protein
VEREDLFGEEIRCPEVLLHGEQELFPGKSFALGRRLEAVLFEDGFGLDDNRVFFEKFLDKNAEAGKCFSVCAGERNSFGVILAQYFYLRGKGGFNRNV